MATPHDRRTFIRNVLKTSLMTAAAGSLPLFDLLALPALAAESPPLAVRRGVDIARLVRNTIEALGGMTKFVRPGNVVVVKPNIGWDRTVELAANTHPEVVRAVVKLCLEAGARQVHLFDRTCNDPRRCYAASGIAAALAELNSDRVELAHIDPRAFREVAIRGGRTFASWEFYQPALEADVFINVPVAKHHSIARLTLGMKNLMGVIGGSRGRLHTDIGESLADINSVMVSTLTVIDATRILVANGPQGGRLEDVRRLDTLIASADIVAADAYAATLFDLKPEQVPSIVAGARRGLGSMDLNRSRLV
jgi:uncharacterized protein (DUF362 family)